MTKTVLIAGILVVAVLASCEDVPVWDVSPGFAVEVSQLGENEGAIQLDFLWVVDNSASMCQEQYALSQSFDIFVEQLSTYLNVDIRLAVTTTDVPDHQGEFQDAPAKTYPPACVEDKVWPCLGDADCKKKFGAGWDCKAYAANKMYNKNGSVNSTCIFKCAGDSDCCKEFCHSDECADNESCFAEKCKDAPTAECTFKCRQGSGDSGNGCLRPPATEDCPVKPSKVLSLSNADLFKCIASVQPQQSYAANMEQGLKAAWMSLDPYGVNADQSSGFLRKDAYLIIVFVSDEDDCSIDEDFCSPNWDCETNDDCPASTKCKLDKRFSQLEGEERRLCCGSVKKDYYNICSLLGEYKGTAHHQCVYDLSCKDCTTDDDCDYGWYCKQDKKCRPDIFSLTNIATYQAPPGTPIFSLTPVAEYYSKFRSLKSDPAKVLVAAITGDGEPQKSDKKSLISDACLEDAKLERCVEYSALKEKDELDCNSNLDDIECAGFLAAKLECVRECYVASKGDSKNSTVARNTYVCESNFGKADFGGRYVALSRMFGPNGVVSNICSEDGIAPAMKTLAELIIKRVTKICLPLPYEKGETIVVTKTLVAGDGSEERIRLVEGDLPDGDYKFEEPTQDCCFFDQKLDACTGTLTAITFNEVLEPNAVVEVKYQARFEESEEEL